MGHSLDRSLSNIFLFSRILGLMPLSQDSTGFSRSTFGTVVSLLHVSIMASGTAWFVFLRAPIIEQPFFQILLKTEFCFLLTYMIACIICPLLSVRDLNEIVDDLRSSDVFLADFGVVLDVSSHIKFTCFYTLILLVLYMIPDKESYLRTAYYNWFYLIFHALESQIIGMLDMILSRFLSVLKTLRKLWHDEEHSSQEVVKLSNIYRLLNKSARKANKTFSLQLLLISGITFVRVVIDCYGIFSNFNLTQISQNIVLSGWALTSMMIFYRLIKRISSIRRKSKEFNTLLYEMMIFDKTNDLAYNRKLRLHAEMMREVSFSACGFFKLDYTLLHSMIAAATTYLVILIQFSK